MTAGRIRRHRAPGEARAKAAGQGMDNMAVVRSGGR